MPWNLTGTIQFSTPYDSKVDITVVVTTVGYTATAIGFTLFTASFTRLTVGYKDTNIAPVTAIKLTAEMDYVRTQYRIASVVTLNSYHEVDNVAPLTLHGASPPPPGPFPPPPTFGPITGAVTLEKSTFSFTVSTGEYTADTLHYAFFAANGGILGSDEEHPTSSTVTWTAELRPSQQALAAYVQVVVESSDRGSSGVLTLKW